ncbi:MAG: oxidoreductase [Phycisphaeraceae bacterium]|nr:MAG: oxidoreductase [Phycisphaeraceae bacterium]
MPNRSPRLLLISGSLRVESVNRKAIEVAAIAAEKAGAEIDRTDPLDILFPIYNQDDEDKTGIPDKALALRERMKKADGFLIGCPEYNGSITGALKNAIDWASRPHDGEQPLECFRHKTAALIAASGGKLGGIRGLPETRRILSGIGTHVIAFDFALSGANDVFAADGTCTDDNARAGLERIGTSLAEITAALIAGK